MGSHAFQWPFSEISPLYEYKNCAKVEYTKSYGKRAGILKLRNIRDVKKFISVLDTCKRDVYLKSLQGDVFNLKSSLSQYIAIGRLLEENGDSLELFADDPADEALLIGFLGELDKEEAKRKSSKT